MATASWIPGERAKQMIVTKNDGTTYELHIQYISPHMMVPGDIIAGIDFYGISPTRYQVTGATYINDNIIDIRIRPLALGQLGAERAIPVNELRDMVVVYRFNSVALGAAGAAEAPGAPGAARAAGAAGAAEAPGAARAPGAPGAARAAEAVDIPEPGAAIKYLKYKQKYLQLKKLLQNQN